MLRNEFLRRFLAINRATAVQKCNKSSAQVNLEKLERESTDVEVVDEELIRREEEIERKRNKSRLKEHHRNILHGQNPHLEPKFWFHGTLRYNRKIYGRYGQASGVDPSLCWPTKEELQETIEYEQVAYPKTIPQMAAEAKAKREEKAESTRKRQEEIVAKVAQLDQWKKELHDKISKKEAEAYEAKARKERLIEEVRRHFGYTVDPHEEKFQQLLEKKEKEQRKAMKEARRKAKEEKLAQKLVKKNTETAVEESERDTAGKENKE